MARFATALQCADPTVFASNVEFRRRNPCRVVHASRGGRCWDSPLSADSSDLWVDSNPRTLPTFNVCTRNESRKTKCTEKCSSSVQLGPGFSRLLGDFLGLLIAANGESGTDSVRSAFAGLSVLVQGSGASEIERESASAALHGHVKDVFVQPVNTLHPFRRTSPKRDPECGRILGREA